jgi:hypothetical protein
VDRTGQPGRGDHRYFERIRGMDAAAQVTAGFPPYAMARLREQRLPST